MGLLIPQSDASDDGILGWQLHQLDHIQTICASLQADNRTDTSSLSFTGWMFFLTRDNSVRALGY